MSDTPWNRVLRHGDRLLEEILQQSSDSLVDGSCESPIEETFALALNALRRVLYCEVDWCDKPGMSLEEFRENARLPGDAKVPERLWRPNYFASAAPQVKIDNYRVDFLILHRKGISDVGGVVVECDGHEFHEKTKEQAARDKARDRHLQENGFKVFRFTGSEIWKDPLECAESALSVAHSIGLDSECARDCHKHGDIDGTMRALRYALQQ